MKVSLSIALEIMRLAVEVQSKTNGSFTADDVAKTYKTLLDAVLTHRTVHPDGDSETITLVKD